MFGNVNDDCLITMQVLDICPVQERGRGATQYVAGSFATVEFVWGNSFGG